MLNFWAPGAVAAISVYVLAAMTCRYGCQCESVTGAADPVGNCIVNAEALVGFEQWWSVGPICP